MPFCSACGAQVNPGSAYCPSCGSKIVTATGQPAGTPVVPTYSAAHFEADTKALRKLNVFAIILLVGGAVGIITTVASFVFGLYSFRVAPAGTTSMSSFFAVYGVTTGVGGIIGIVALLELRSALKSLVQIDRARFELPAKLTLLLIVAEPVLLVGILGLFYAILSLPTAEPFSSSNLGYFVVGFVLEGIGGIAAVVGIIGGAALGMWRMGARYGEGSMQVGAILYVLPFIQIFGAVLLLIGVSGARRKVGGTAPVQKTG
jgi:hypothetical protein